MSPLKQDNTKKKQVNKTLLDPKKKFKAKDDKEYEVKVIIDSTIYDKKVNDQISSFHYLVL